MSDLYNYKAYVTKVYDGDTITVDIDLGLKVLVRGEVLRLARIDTPEVRGKERPLGILARDYLRKLILGKEIRIQTVKDKKGKYGRYLAEVWLDGVNINDHLLCAGHANRYMTDAEVEQC